MREQILVLEALQQIDLELSELEVHLTDYPNKISDLEEELKSSKEVLSILNNKKEELVITRSQIENDISQNEESIKKSEEKLFEIKTHKEYQALQKEITETKRINSDHEEKLLEEMEKIEKVEKEITEKTEKLATMEAEHQEKISEYTLELEEVKTAYDPKIQQKQDTVQKLDPEILPLYEKIFKKNNGEVLAIAKNEVCTGCYMNVPAQLFNEILTFSRIIQCPSCLKILYCEEEETSTSEENSEAKTG
ncbi:MAG: C4-type zinc ribbon domain-containing protein [Thermodesulfobacteriota bacterium]